MTPTAAPPKGTSRNSHKPRALPLEAQEVMRRLRPYLFSERGVPREQVSISGYWRCGRDEEGFREWKSELAHSEG